MPTVIGTEVPTTLIPREYRGLYGRRGMGDVAGWVQDLIKLGAGTTSDIFKARYGQPPAGTTYSADPRTGVVTQYARYPDQPGATLGIFPPSSFGSSTTDLVKWGLIAAVVVGGIAALKR